MPVTTSSGAETETTMLVTSSSGAETETTTPVISSSGPAPDLPPPTIWGIACETDEFEVNDEAMQAAPVGDPCPPADSEGYWYCSASVSACHGLDDEDWYALPPAADPTGGSVFELQLWILPEFSACNCSGDPVPMGPGLAATVEIYDAETLTLISEISGTEPTLWLYDESPQSSPALLLRVLGPADVSWTYDLWVTRRDSVWEDSCEC